MHPSLDIPWGDSGLAGDDLRTEIAGLAGRLNSATARWLGLVYEADATSAWAGFASCAAWLSWQCGIAPGTAKEYVRTARALARRDLIRAEFLRGALSYSQVRALTRGADALADTPVDEAKLVELARHATGAQLERLIRELRRCTTADDEDGLVERQYASWYLDENGDLVLRARLTGDAAAAMLTALERARDDADAEGDRRVAALTALAATALASTTLSGRPPATISVIADAEALAAAAAEPPVDKVSAETSSTATIRFAATGQPASIRTLAAMLCDSQVETLARLTDGSLTSLGRTRRQPNARIRRLVLTRHEGRCAVPGCGRRRDLHLHHVRHWARGGETSAANLIPLCGPHHRRHHDGHLGISRGRHGDIHFTDPLGQPITAIAEPRAADASELVDDPRGREADAAGRAIALTPRRAEPVDYDYATSVLLTPRPTAAA